jgi:hypothetical protein
MGSGRSGGINNADFRSGLQGVKIVQKTVLNANFSDCHFELPTDLKRRLRGIVISSASSEVIGPCAQPTRPPPPLVE